MVQEWFEEHNNETQHTFRGLVESMPRWVRAVLATNEDPHNFRQVVIVGEEI